ncbi:ubiquinone biosynthesis accessory factor UbiJ [Candidatus Profftia tarda]|uniref:Ubiquinone biosynthesis accessory factor UbiJ n=1 Tax=Candidatus Profftia tarda TaxID=1177216 RepID=A0A8E4GHZ1_9ENTR|nr:SCP2 sterol-binding domain-containing protein [Candidatus Profftia tarda]CAD6513052.1 Uncharacterized protein YigP [Candidatus Profftia tarda]
MLKLLFLSTVEVTLNRILYSDDYLRNKRQYLNGKVLCIVIKDIKDLVLYLIFSDQHVDVIGSWEYEVDSFIRVRMSVLWDLYKRCCFTELIRSEDLVLEGDIQVIQQFILLINLAEWDPTDLLASYTGDIIAQGISMFLRKSTRKILNLFDGHKEHMVQIITEEWNIAPGSCETEWFYKEIDALSHHSEILSKRFSQFEDKL